MKIEIWSDVACPFCYIGKRKFEQALASFDHREEIEIVWKSYQLDPTPQDQLPKDLDVYQYLADRKGWSYKESKKMHANVAQMAKNVGLEYDFDRAKLSNTFDAARLLHLAKQYDKQGEAKEKLLAAHFTLGLDVADSAVLIQIGEEIGIPGDALINMLKGDDFKLDVTYDIQEAHNLGVTGVPFFVFDRKYGVSGAQEPNTFLQTLEKAYAEWKKEN